jgi:hypothetical protein
VIKARGQANHLLNLSWASFLSMVFWSWFMRFEKKNKGVTPMQK